MVQELLATFQESLDLRRAFNESMAPTDLAPLAASAFVVEICSILGTSAEPFVRLPTIGVLRVVDSLPVFHPDDFLRKELSFEVLSAIHEFGILAEWDQRYLTSVRRTRTYYLTSGDNRYALKEPKRLTNECLGFDVLREEAFKYLSLYLADRDDREFFKLPYNALELAMCIGIHDELYDGNRIHLESIGTFVDSECFFSNDLKKLTHARIIRESRLRATSNR